VIDKDNYYLLEDPKRMAVFTPGFLFEGSGLEEDELAELQVEKNKRLDLLCLLF
jgi:hypothetical protein